MQRRVTLLISFILCVALAGCGGNGGGGGDGTNNGADAGNNGSDAGCEPAAEVCDGQDNDCDGEVDEDDADDAQTFYPDSDSDGFGGEAGAVSACEQPQGFITEGGDCDDNDAAVHPGADEVCDNLDNDCDSQVDQGEVAPLDCTNQTGVCAGSTIAVCENSEYATCGADQFGADYVEDDGENWRCDGLDNDCDGDVDEVCCGSDGSPSIPASRTIASPADSIAPKLTKAAAGAPSEAEYLVAWSDNQTIRLQHVDATGAEVGSARSVAVSLSNEGIIEGVDVVSGANGYDLVWTTTRTNDSNDRFYADLWLQGFDAQLSTDGRRENYVSSYFEAGDDTTYSNPIGLSNPAIAAIGDERFIAWTDEFFALFSTGYGLRGIRYNVNDRANPAPILDLTTNRGGRSSNTALVPAIAASESTFAIAWAHGGNEQIHGVTYSADGSPSPSFTINVDEATGADNIDVVWSTDDTFQVIYTRYDGANAALATRQVSASTGDVGDETRLTDDAERNWRPDAEEVDTDGDCTPDRLVMVWEQGDSDPKIAIGSTALASPQLIDAPPTLKATGQNARWPSLARGSAAMGAIWKTSTSPNRVQFVPVSLDGVGICNSL